MIVYIYHIQCLIMHKTHLLRILLDTPRTPHPHRTLNRHRIRTHQRNKNSHSRLERPPRRIRCPPVQPELAVEPHQPLERRGPGEQQGLPDVQMRVEDEGCGEEKVEEVGKEVRDL